MRYLFLTALPTLAACAPYYYDETGYSQPGYGPGYDGGYYASAYAPENCGTPDEPKACPPARPHRRYYPTY